MENQAEVKVTSCTFKKNWQGKNSQVPLYEILFSNGTKCESFNVQIPEGTPLADCTITESQYGKKVKWNKRPNPNEGGKPTKGNSPRNYKADFISFAASYTKDLVVSGKCDLKQFRKVFNTMYQVMEDKFDEVTNKSEQGQQKEEKEGEEKK